MRKQLELQLAAQLEEHQGRLEAMEMRDSELTALLHRQEAASAEGRESLDRMGRLLAERHQLSADLAARIEGKQEFLKGSKQRLEELAAGGWLGLNLTVPLKETLKGAEEILTGKCDETPEQDFYMIGRLGD